MGLGFALLRLPLDQKAYARELAKNLKGSKRGKGGKGGSPQKGGMVRLSEVKSVPVNQDGSGAMKQVWAVLQSTAVNALVEFLLLY